MENLDGTTKRLMSDPADHRFELDKRSQLFIRTNNETLSVASIGVSNPDGLSVEINRWSRSLNSNRLC
jgi:hypothetical protein